jgi:hypothetical protein
MQITPVQIVTSLGLALAAWYLMAMIYNRRRGRAAYRWLVDGLDVFGPGHEGKWLGSAGSGAQMAVPKAGHPFRRVEVIYLLESRELLPLWLVDLLRNKRDQLIFKALLRAKPLAEVEIAPAASRMARRIRDRVDDSWNTAEVKGYYVASRGKDSGRVVEAFRPFLSAYGDQLRSISWSEGKPDLIVVLALGPLIPTADNASNLFTSLKAAVERAIRSTDA